MLPASPLLQGLGKSFEEEQIHQGQAAVRRAGPFQGRLRRCRAPVINTWRQHDQQVTNRPTRLDHLDPPPPRHASAGGGGSFGEELHGDQRRR